MFQTLTSAIKEEIIDCIRLVQFRARNIDWVWRRYSTTPIWVKYRAGRGAVLNWKGCEAGRIDQGVTNRLVARDRLLSFLVSPKPLHPVSRPGKITMVVLVEMSREKIRQILHFQKVVIALRIVYFAHLEIPVLTFGEKPVNNALPDVWQLQTIYSISEFCSLCSISIQSSMFNFWRESVLYAWQ